MAEETTSTETVKKTSNGTVKIAIEEYNELKELASRPQTVTHHTTVKTPAMRAEDNILFGSLWMGSGAALLVVGGIQLAVGLKQKRAL